MATSKELRFAMDEKGMKVLAPTLVGQTISYWEGDKDLKHGLVKVELALGRGKKLYDKRDDKAKRDVQRQMAKDLGRRE